MKVKVWGSPGTLGGSGIPDRTVEADAIASQISDQGGLQLTASRAEDGVQVGWVAYAPGCWTLAELIEPVTDEVRQTLAERERAERLQKSNQSNWSR